MNSNSKRATYKEFFGCSRSSLCSVLVVCFLKFLTPFTLGGHNFLISNLFFIIVSVSDVPRGQVQVFFGQQEQQSPPLESGLP